MISLTINGLQVSVEDGSTLLEAAKFLGITRDEFIDEYERYRPLSSRVVIKLGRLGAVFFFGFDDARRKALETRLQKMPPGFTRDGKAWSFVGPAFQPVKRNVETSKPSRSGASAAPW